MRESRLIDSPLSSMGTSAERTCAESYRRLSETAKMVFALACCLSSLLPLGAAPPDLLFDSAKSSLTVQFVPRSSGKVRIELEVQDDTGRRNVLSETVDAKKAERFSKSFNVPLEKQCFYIVKIIDGKDTSIGVKKLYNTTTRSESTSQKLQRILGVPLSAVGQFLEKLTEPFHLGPHGRDLFAIDLDTKKIKLLFSFQGEGIASPCVSPDGKQIALVLRSADKPEHLRIFIFRVGETPVKLTDGVLIDYGKSPIWSPDGKVLYYLKGSKIYEYDTKNKESRERHVKQAVRLVELLGFARDNSGRILATSNLAESYVLLWLVDLKSGEATLLSYDDGFLALPNLSPDGKRLAYAKYEGEGKRSALYLRERGSKEICLTDEKFDVISPRWSPTGKFVVFISTQQ